MLLTMMEKSRPLTKVLEREDKDHDVSRFLLKYFCRVFSIFRFRILKCTSTQVDRSASSFGVERNAEDPDYTFRGQTRH